MHEDFAREQLHLFSLRVSTGLWTLLKDLAIDEIPGASVMFLDHKSMLATSPKADRLKRMDAVKTNKSE